MVLGLNFFLFNSQCLAKETIAKLSAFKGEVELERKGKSIPLELNMPLFSKDKIRTKVGSAEIDLLDGSTLKIECHTEIILQQLERRRKILGARTKSYLCCLLNIITGEISGEIKPRKDLVTEFETATAIVAIRGPVIFQINPKKTGKTVTFNMIWNPETNWLHLKCFTGILEVYLAEGERIVTSGEGELLEGIVNRTNWCLHWLKPIPCIPVAAPPPVVAVPPPPVGAGAGGGAGVASPHR